MSHAAVSQYSVAKLSQAQRGLPLHTGRGSRGARCYEAILVLEPLGSTAAWNC